MPPDDVKYKYCMKETKFYENERFEMIVFNLVKIGYSTQ